MKQIYMDYNATTPLDPEVVKEMRPYLEDVFGNPSSNHEFGIRARLAVEKARKQIAGLLGCRVDEILFTSGGTESNNFAIKGAAYALKNQGNHIITSSVEHPSVSEVCHYLENNGFRVTYLPVDEFGMVDPDDVKGAIIPETILVTIMHANNETGTIQPISEISRITRMHGILLHADAAQSCGKIGVNVENLGVDLLSVAGHKLYAPKGIGALYMRQGVRLEKLMHGADHEMNRRAGTENVLEIAGLGKACELAYDGQQPGNMVKELRDMLYTGIKERIPEVKLNGHPEQRLPNTLNLSFPGIEANRLLSEMKGIAASAGAACHSDRTDISSVLSAMKVPVQYAMGTIRFSLGRMTTEEEIRMAISIITDAYTKLTGSQQPAVIDYQSLPDIRLTQYTSSLGCACKIRPQDLQVFLKDIPQAKDPAVMVDLRTNDDAAVYRIHDQLAIVQTVDFIPPVVDDPYSYGAIAAANALSDVYAMGAVPLFALNIVAFPMKLIGAQVLKEVLRGATDKASEAGISIIGGHSIEDNEPKFGLVVTGSARPGKILKNSTARPGDAIILTKPVGTGILTTGLKRGMLDHDQEKSLCRVMAELNRTSCEIMMKYPVNACTDVTGFGLLGHLKEMVEGSGVVAEIVAEKVPVMDGVLELVTAGIIPGGTHNNLSFVKEIVRWDDSVPESMKLVLADAQTSGGLLIALPNEYSEQLLADLHEQGITEATEIGRMLTGVPSMRVLG